MRSFPSRHRLLSLLLLPLLFIGCAREEPEAGVPEGWEEAGARWWRTGADTTGAFRNLESLSEMGVQASGLYAATGELAQQGSLQRAQLKGAVKRSLVRLYRNEPEIVDSLFERIVTPLIEQSTLRGDAKELVERNKKQAYTVLRRHFREPTTTLRVGQDVPVQYPDSLRRKGVAGAVRMQVRVDAQGEPIAIELIDGVHPVLDEAAMRATTRMRWQPAYLRRQNEWEAMAAWARFSIHFTAASARYDEAGDLISGGA